MRIILPLNDYRKCAHALFKYAITLYELLYMNSIIDSKL